MTLLNVAIQVEGMMQHYATTEIFVAELQEADFYFWQGLWQQKNCEECLWQGMLY